MKRPKQWSLIYVIGLLWFYSVLEVESLKATSLIFAKTTTTTTSTETPDDKENNSTATQSSSEGGIETETKPILTGIPQIDYIHDPNLPRELNGYNLTDYPFYETVPPPEEINFKCDGLHDGFYASIPHKCQVYHHCLFGTRYDFLCANYTAFDQKTFICHFVSEVDCNNSAKYFHRNDALYKAASTTTIPPPTTSTIATTTTTQLPSPSATGGGGNKNKPPRHRWPRPPPRRRPAYEYYDETADGDYIEEYYDDEPVPMRWKRPPLRDNRRPQYEYDDYPEDYDRYKPRGRGPYRRRHYDDDRRVRPVADDVRRKPYEDDRYPLDDDRRRLKKYPSDDIAVEERRSFDDRRRPIADDSERRYSDRRPVNRHNRRPAYDDTYERRRPLYEGDRRTSRPVKDDRFEVDEPKVKPVSSSSIYSKPRAPPIIRRPVPVNERSKYEYTSTSTQSVPPSAKGEEYYDDEYYDDRAVPRASGRYESRHRQRPDSDINYDDRSREISAPIRPRPRDEHRNRPNKKRPDDDEDIHYMRRKPIDDSDDSKRRRPADELYLDVDDRKILETTSRFRKPPRITTTSTTTTTTTSKPRIFTSRTTSAAPIEQKKSEEEYYDEEYDQEYIAPEKPSAIEETSTESKSTTPPVTSNKREPYVKIVKRPFLPSRGGNPLAARGLQPVGNRAQELLAKKPDVTTTTTTTTSTTTTTTEAPLKSLDDYRNSFKPRTGNSKYEYITESDDSKSTQTPSNIRINLRGNFNVGRNSGGNSYRQPIDITTSKPDKFKDNINAIKNPLDIIENEYDVTLNDALNPTLPNTNRNQSPTGFVVQRDYSFPTYTRPRYVNYEPLHQAGSDLTYQIQEPVRTTTLQQYQTQFLQNYNTRQVRGHHQYTGNF